MTTSLVSTPTTARRQIEQVEVGDLVTVMVYEPATKDFTAESGARFKRAAHGNVWVQLVGLSVPAPYEIGDNLVIRQEQLKDW